VSRLAKPAIIRYYFDADVIGLAKIFLEMRNDVTYPGDPGGIGRDRRVRASCPIKDPQTDDDVWIPETAAQGWLIITRDRHIQDRPAEIEAVHASDARMVNLASDEAVSRFAQMEILMCQWRRVEALLEARGPFIYLLSRTAFRRLAI
jgi:hypothetical protein